jgi:hypothetical protein
MSRRSALLCALLLSFTSSIAREARAQGEGITVTILRRTAVKANPSYAAPTLGFLNPSTIGVTQLRTVEGFVQLLLRQIDRRWSTSGYGYIAAVDVAVDSAPTAVATKPEAAPARPDTAARARPAPAIPARQDSVAPRPSAAVPARQDTTTATKADPAPRPAPAAQARSHALETTAGLLPHNVTVEATTHAGARGVRVAITDEMERRLEQLPPTELVEKLVVVEGSDFANGVIEVDVAGVPAAGAMAGARGFVGIAFRVQPDLKTYDAFYLRPTNGRAEDQERRNHSAQYISHPAWTWNRLRQETPGRYEAYADLVPDAWTPLRIEVRGTRARLFVNGQAQPTLIVNDVKSGEKGRGAIALWIDTGTIAHFRNLRVSPSD